MPKQPLLKPRKQLEKDTTKKETLGKGFFRYIGYVCSSIWSKLCNVFFYIKTSTSYYISRNSVSEERNDNESKSSQSNLDGRNIALRAPQLQCSVYDEDRLGYDPKHMDPALVALLNREELFDRTREEQKFDRPDKLPPVPLSVLDS